MKNIELPSSITEIAINAFRGCAILESLEIPSSVTKIDNWAFCNCTSFEEISIPESVIDIGISAFYRTKYYNDSSKWDDGVLYIDNALVAIDRLKIPAECIIKDFTRLIASYAFSENKSPVTKVTIPNSVTNICDEAFYGCGNLNSVTFEDGSLPLTIGDYAFSESGIANIKIPTRTAKMGHTVFSYCENLTNVIFENNEQLTSIPSNCFYH